MNPERSAALRRGGLFLLSLAVLALAYRPLTHSKAGRWLLDVSMLRVVNQTDAPVKDVRLSYTRESNNVLNYAEIGTLAPGEVREIKVWAKSLTGAEVVYAFSGAVRTSPIVETIYAGSILEVTVVEGGWIRRQATH